MDKKRSQMDELFYELYGYYPSKDGQAYEMIVAAAFKLLLNKDITYDQRLRGEYSKTVYQLDAIIKDDVDTQMVEAKDFTVYNKKVGRDDIQKLQGALTDLSVGWGVFASATGYTAPAKKYAQSAKENPLQKDIELYNIRPSTFTDEKGRIKKIVINLSAHYPDYENAKVHPIFTEESKLILIDKFKNESIELKIDKILNSKGAELISIYNLTLGNQPTVDYYRGEYLTSGCWIINGGYIDINGALYQIYGLTYEVQIKVTRDEIVIESEGKPRLYVKDESGKINKLISDADLKKVIFKDGMVI